MVEIICLTEESFSDAATKISPFLVPKDVYYEWTLNDIRVLDLSYYKQYPEFILKIVSGLIGETHNSYNLTLVNDILKKIDDESPKQAQTKIYQKLKRSIKNLNSK